MNASGTGHDSTYRRDTARRALALMLVLACLLAGGCSVAGMVYERLDWIVTREIDRWFDLERAQKDRFKAALAERLAAHRREELPRWVELLHASAAHIEGSATPAEVLRLIEDSRHLLHRSTAHLLGPLAATLAELEPGQVEHFRRALAEDNAEYAAEYLDPSPAERAARRLEDAVEGVERWSGRLDAAQGERMQRLMAELPDGAEQWRDHRLGWQAALLDQLNAGAAAEDFERLLHGWWIGDEGMDPAYAEQLARNRRVTAEALSELIALFEPRQRERAARRLRDLAEDLAALHG